MSTKSILLCNYEDRTIWLEGEITDRVARNFKKYLEKMNKSGSGPIVFYISGAGGDIFLCLDMIYAVRKSGSPVASVAHGQVNSASFLLTQSGHTRLALPGTKFGFHRVVSRGIPPSAKESSMSVRYHLEAISQLSLADALQLVIFLRRGRPVKQVFTLFKDEAILSVAQAIKLGLMDYYFKESDFEKDKKKFKNMYRVAKNLLKTTT